MLQVTGQFPAAVITGAAKRIGRSIAKKLHQKGYSVVIHYSKSEEEAQCLAAELNAARAGSAVLCKGDLTLSNSLVDCCEEIIDSCFCAFGRCDVLVNNASAFYPTPLLPADNANDEPIDVQVAELLGSNTVAPFLLTRVFARRQKKCGDLGSGRNLSIVNLGDSMIDLPLTGFLVYTMAKHAVEGLTKAAAVELAPLSIRVNAVSPGICLFSPATPLKEQEAYRQKIPLGNREASPEQIADAVLFLVSEEASYITGATLKVDGALSLARA